MLETRRSDQGENSKGLLNQANALLLQDLAERVTDVLRIRSLDTRLAEHTIQNELGGDTAWKTDGKGHGAVALGRTVGFECRGEDLLEK